MLELTPFESLQSHVGPKGGGCREPCHQQVYASATTSICPSCEQPITATAKPVWNPAEPLTAALWGKCGHAPSQATPSEWNEYHEWHDVACPGYTARSHKVAWYLLPDAVIKMGFDITLELTPTLQTNRMCSLYSFEDERSWVGKGNNCLDSLCAAVLMKEEADA